MAMPLTPQRTHRRLPDGSWVVTVAPPKQTGFKASLLKLSEDQFRRYTLWLNGELGLIQVALPELSAADREVLLSGISEQQWDKAFKDEGSD